MHDLTRDPAHQAAIARAEALVARFPDRAPPHFSLARALHDAGAHAAAAEAYATAAALQPDLMMAWLHQAECLLAVGETRRARPAAERARALAQAQGHSGPLVEADELLEAIADLIGD